jgi:thiamine-monophosphate kinase
VSIATIADLNEAELVARIQGRLAKPPDWVVVGIGDDAAVIEPERNRLEVLTVDALVEGVHFERRFTPADAIGYRALAVNLSDLAAMGASPRVALLSLALPQDLLCTDFDAMVGGLAALAARHHIHLVGGNLTRTSGPLVLDVTVTGSVKRRQVLTRQGARPGDEILVTGSLGAAAAGLQFLQQETEPSQTSANLAPAQQLVHRYRYPQPRLRMGQLLSRSKAATSCVDLSDGLADGLRQIAKASDVGIAIDADAIPIDSDARAWFQSQGRDPVLEALTRGDDYELAICLRPRQRGRLAAAIRHGDAPVTRVGVCTAALDLVLRRIVDGRSHLEPLPQGYSHFK